MGYRALSAVLHHSKAKASTKLVLVAIANYYDDKGDRGAWPSQELIASIANCTVRNVQRAIKELVEIGEIETIVHGGRGKTFDRQTNLYYIILDCPEGCDSSLNHKDLPDKIDTLTRQNRQSNPTKWADLPDADDALTVNNSNELKVMKLSRNLTAVS
jgi:hypothetical protein